jgi:SAM-dependent methyltransferase
MSSQPLSLSQKVLMRMFGRPTGLLGRIGGLILAFEKGEFIPWVINHLQIAPGEQILEVGFGPGVALHYVAKQTPAGHIAGVDYSEVMVRQATARNAAAIAAGKVVLHYGPAAALPFGDQTFDGAFSINSMQLWPDAVAGLRAIKRVLKPGGRIALGFTAHAGQSAADLPDLATAAGFHAIRLEQSAQGVCLVAAK